mmetsp:Transcript_226/g.743  ORF Transcript_226/g.743 Transcript_226/m.743 type:complete len:376 (-) Transcript_226:226-1353(-)|eukprot:scaffold4372_cov397-Prasinococcus_capsulatus_cf.AAC.34
MDHISASHTGLAQIPAHAVQPSKNQVAGHRFEDGKQGCLANNEGLFYKPIQSGARGEREKTFYQEHLPKLPLDVQTMFPNFYRLVQVSLWGMGGTSHLELEDITHGYLRPCVMDVKVGFQTWYPGAPEEYISKCKFKDIATGNAKLGFKVCGLQTFLPFAGRMVRADKSWCKQCAHNYVAVRELLEKYLWDGQNSLAKDVLGGNYGALAQLEALERWFSSQTMLHFYSASVLLVYEGSPGPLLGGSAPVNTDGVSEDVSTVGIEHSAHGGASTGAGDGMSVTEGASVDESEGASGSGGQSADPARMHEGSSRRARVIMVDFAHTMPAPNNTKDENFLGGLRELIKHLKEVLESSTAGRQSTGHADISFKATTHSE